MSTPHEWADGKFIQFCIQFAALSVLYYDYILTFRDEFNLVWRAKFRLSTLLYICCRYALVANLLYTLNIAGKLNHGCDQWYRTISALSLLGRTAVIISFTARAYAVYRGNKIILAIVGSLGLCTSILGVLHVPHVRCVGPPTDPIYNTLLGIMMVVFETVTTALTTWKCVTAMQGRFKRDGSNQKMLHYVVFQQGISYFCVVTLLTLASIVLNFEAPRGSFLQRLLNAFVLPFSCLFTARFILHLRAWEVKTTKGKYSSNAETVIGEQSVIEFSNGPNGDGRGAVFTTLMPEFNEDTSVMYEIWEQERHKRYMARYPASYPLNARAKSEE